MNLGQIFAAAGAVAGLAGLAAIVFWLQFRGVLNLAKFGIFAKLTKKQTFTLLLVFMILSFSGLVAMLITYALPSGESVYRIDVVVQDQGGRRVQDARVYDSLGNEAVRTQGGWRFELAAALVPDPNEVALVVHAETDYLTGSQELMLGTDFIHTVTVRLEGEFGTVRGVVIDVDDQPVEGASVSVFGYEDEAVETSPTGNFEIEAHSLVGQQVTITAARDGYVSVSRPYPVGDQPVRIVLGRDQLLPPSGLALSCCRRPGDGVTTE